MSEWAQTKLPCPECSSSDAYAINTDGWGTCFSCQVSVPPDGGARQRQDDELRFLTIEEYIPLTRRGVSQETCRRYGYGIANYRDGKVQVANFRDDKGKLVGQKVRLPGKDFLSLGKTSDRIWGLDQARPGGKLFVITEGEIDKLVTSEAMGENWPVGSLPSGAGSAVKAIQANLEKLETYEKVVLAFDDDEPGRGATDKCVELFSPGKVFIARFGGHKDPDDMRREMGNKALRDAIWGATPWRPDGVLDFADLKARLKASVPHGYTMPWPMLNEQVYGLRPREVLLLTAATGSGKTSIVSEMAYHWRMVEGLRLGLIYLEEGIERAGRRMLAIHLNKPIHLPDVELTDEEFDKAYAEVFPPGQVITYDHFGSLDPDVLLSRMRYMRVSLGCDIIILDHLSIVVSGSDLDVDERRLLDRIMTKLRSFAEETCVSLVVVVHLKRPATGKAYEEGRQVSMGSLRGSGGIGQMSDIVVACERNQQAKDPKEKNTTQLRVLKSRLSGNTALSDQLLYDHKTGRLKVLVGGEEIPWSDDDEQRDY